MVKLWEFSKDDIKVYSVFSELNGEEPSFQPEKWNGVLKKTHNCYAYMADYIKESFNKKPQPGLSQMERYLRDDELRDCNILFRNMKLDNPTIIKSSFRLKCPKGMRKAYLAIDDEENSDYHFYRLDKNQFWSHKPGATNVQNKDANQKFIFRPDIANRQTNSRKYEKSCGYFCFDPSKTKLSNKIIKL